MNIMKKTLFMGGAALSALLYAPIAFAQDTQDADVNISAQKSADAIKAMGDTEALLPEVKKIDADPALWVVKDEDTTIYLFGTIHLLKPELDWFNDEIRTAYDKSDELVIEMIEPSQEEMIAQSTKLMIDSSGKSLRDKMTPQQRKIYTEAMADIGLPENALDPIRPWAAGVQTQVMLMTKGGFDPNSGADKIITKQAERDGKPILGLETMGYQLSIISSGDEEKHIQFLVEGLKDRDKVVPELNKMVDGWASGDQKKLNETLVLPMESAEYKIFFERVFKERNINWAAWLDARMDRPGTVFVAVGAGHLVGDESVQNHLAEYGHQSKLVTN
ncbi:hypothetical protein LPB140_00805 [Sphingorhabdus lutea]|uniref:TraB/GumN family protein n=1 Tax=Sphingorhabdus lutea TaxID=1913578 RepID=A0A1L3J931_9SPHN|nr:TraB/GumN family protein [Sphingorhabdus lutea]APG61620.1 hypothetical protein LPB140_00805 [Sphingorhabdus lutea]